jgi:hypothetical protein
MWKDKVNVYNKLEDDIEANRRLKASFFQRGEVMW